MSKNFITRVHEHRVLQKQVVACIIVGLLVGVAAGYLAGTAWAGRRSPSGKAAGSKTITVPIGALLLLSGAQESYGKRGQAALQLAIEDVNRYAEKVGSPFRFKLLPEDTRTDPQTAVSKLQSLASLGVKVVIGPYTSAETAAVKNFADANHIVVISPASISSNLAIPGDYVFRLIVPSKIIGWTLARAVVDRGFTKAAVIYRNDAWGSDLYAVFKKRFEELGGRVVGVPYAPKAQDLSAEVAKLSEAASRLGSGTAVVAITFEKDGLQILTLAAKDPVLSRLQWFGSSAIVGSDKIKDEAGSIAVKLGGLISPLYTPPKTPDEEKFVERFKRVYGEAPDSFSMNAYDALWLAALTIIQVGKYDGEAVAKALIPVSWKTYGITGRLWLDENGDRIGGKCGLWKIVKTGEGYKWVHIGDYDSVLDKITWSG